MLKRIFLFALVCTMAAMAQAQSLDGIWKNEETEKNGKTDFYYIFSGSELIVKMTNASDDRDILFVFSYNIPCNYLREGNQLYVTPHKEGIKINLEKIEFKGEYADLEASEKEEIKTQFVGSLNENLIALKEGLGNFRLEITSQTDSTLSIRNEKNRETLFTRVKDE